MSSFFSSSLAGASYYVLDHKHPPARDCARWALCLLLALSTVLNIRRCSINTSETPKLKWVVLCCSEHYLTLEIHSLFFEYKANLHFQASLILGDMTRILSDEEEGKAHVILLPCP